jgi:hypothetical protein
MYKLRIFNHVTENTVNVLTFETKRQSNKFLKDNTEKRGFDFFSKEDRSLEYQKQY